MVDEGINSNVENDVKISTNNALKKVLNPTQMASFRMGKECLPITADMKLHVVFMHMRKLKRKQGLELELFYYRHLKVTTVSVTVMARCSEDRAGSLAGPSFFLIHVRLSLTQVKNAKRSSATV